jgi:hypothetical protein
VSSTRKKTERKKSRKKKEKRKKENRKKKEKKTKERRRLERDQTNPFAAIDKRPSCTHETNCGNSSTGPAQSTVQGAVHSARYKG